MKSRAKAGKACFRFLHFFMLHFGVFAFAPFVVYMFQDVDCALLAPQTLLPRVSGLCSTLSICSVPSLCWRWHALAALC